MKYAKRGLILSAAILVGACANVPGGQLVSNAWLKSSAGFGTQIPSAALSVSDKHIGPDGGTMFTAVDGRSGDSYECRVNVGLILPYLPPPPVDDHPANCHLINARSAR